MNDPSGSRWRRWDLHFHTPKSHDYHDKSLTPAQLVDALVHADIEVVAVTDHHVLDADFIAEMQTVGSPSLTVLPGIEFACPLGGKEGVHFIGIFAEDSNVAYIASELITKSGIANKRTAGKSEKQIYVDFPTTAKLIQDLGGIVSMHGHGKASSIEGIANNSALKEEFKKDVLRDFVDLLEIGHGERQTDYVEIVFPDIGFERPLVVGSDNHNANEYQVRTVCWIKADPTFRGLLMAIREPTSRFWLGGMPAMMDRVEKNKTRYIQKISFSKLSTMPVGEEWLQGDIPLNPGLVAIIGNKGSGKSALSDSIGLLGSCSTSDAFSFLDKDRFCNPKTGRAQHVEAALHWYDGEPHTRRLDEDVREDEPKRVKYLPQNFVERICNELSTSGGGAFEAELKKVVFSKVADADRLGRRSLDELVQFRTQELRKEADSLAFGLAELGIARAALEERLDPAIRSGLQKRIGRVKEEIRSHEAAKPVEKEPPPDDPGATPKSKDDLEALNESKSERETVGGEIRRNERIVVAEQLRAATANKLLDKLKNLQAEFDRRLVDMSTEADALGLDVTTLATLTIDRPAVTRLRDGAIARRDAARKAVDGPAPEGLKAKLVQLDEQIKSLQDRLSRPNREYQAYLEEKSKWEATLSKLTGTGEDPNSSRGLEAELAALDDVPTEIAKIQDEQEKTAERIHELRVAEAGVYTELYGPVQKFISEHPLAKEQLKLEFTVELVQEGFVDNLLSHLNQNKIGSFYGIEDGRTKAEAVAALVDWWNWEGVKEFLTTVVHHLHDDKRPGGGGPVMLKNQIGKGKTAGELYAWLYAMTYVKPRYRLCWEGKVVSQLSAGERGTLLLIFYLLIDDSDMPLIIDQPEANLDNVTIAEKLVDCIRDARDRRQVIIVTHNPNLAVVCDADQIIHAELDKLAGNKITYETGALEHPDMNRFAIDVLEGGRDPFDMRDNTYDVCDQ